MNTKSTYVSAITNGLEAVATILSAVKVISVSVKSLASISEESTHVNTGHKKGVGLGIHKWVLIAGALVGVITIAYLENIVSHIRPKRAVSEQNQRENVQDVYVN